MSQAADDMVAQIREDIEASWQADVNNRIEGRIDLQFVANQQWSADELKLRDGRPSLTINKLTAFLHQITNEIRQNKPAIKCYGVDGSEHDEDLAETFDGLIRQIESRSAAGHIYSHAASLTAACGIGHFRIKTDYTDDDSFEQEIIIERIADPFSVYWDPAAVKPDRSDGSWCALLEKVPVATFRKKYPGKSEASVDTPDALRNDALIWNTAEHILIAEYWCKVPVTKTIMSMGDQIYDVTEWPSATMAGLKEQIASGEVRVRKVTSHVIESWLASGTEILSGPNQWAGRHIPIITIVGAEHPVGDQIVRSGMIRHARDAQKLYNYWRSTAAEAIGQAPKSPWIGTRKMFARDRASWETANTAPTPYLTYDPDPDAPGARPQREHPAEPPAAMWQESKIAADDIKATTGIFDASLGSQGNETSGVAIQARQKQGDTSNYHFTDNLKESLTHAGRILVDLIPKIYDSERIIRILGEDGSEKPVTINQEMPDGMGGTKIVCDLSTARYDVRVDIGPGYSSRRQESADSMLQFAQSVPGSGQVMGDLIAKNMDWPGAEEISKRLKKMLPPGLADDPEPTGGDPSQPQQPPAPNPQQVAQQQAAQQQQAQQQAQQDEAAHTAQTRQLELQERALKVQNQQLQNDKLSAQIEKIRSGSSPTGQGLPNGGIFQRGVQ